MKVDLGVRWLSTEQRLVHRDNLLSGAASHHRDDSLSSAAKSAVQRLKDVAREEKGMAAVPFVDLDNNRLYYEDTGGDAPAIVFTHPAFLDHTVWQGQVARLATEYRLITWDLRGHGMSECNGDFTFWEAADDVVGLLDAIGVQQAVLAGMAEGGSLTLRVGLAHPDRVRGMILMGAPPVMNEHGRSFLNLLGQGWLTVGPVGELADHLLGILFANTDYDGGYFIGRWQSKPPSAWAGVWHAILEGQPENLLERLPSIECPALFLHGAGDSQFPLSIAHEMSARIAHSRGVIEAPGGRYVLALTHPEIVNATIVEFMESL